ncbi:MAG: DMSO/selenate family reductase complex B subunit [Campylobacteraceae bacterium]
MEKNKQFGFFLDQSQCIGCRTCQLTCKDYKDTPIGVSFRRVSEYESGEWLDDKDATSVTPVGVFAYYSSISCNHCDEPACAKVCPTGAMHKTSFGIVEVNPKKCIGCKACAMACPYGSPQYNKQKKHMTKCNGCRERLEQDLLPICVASCPARALHAGPISELREQHGHLASVAPLPKYEVTRPNLVLKPEKHAQSSGSGKGTYYLPQHYQEVDYDIV